MADTVDAVAVPAFKKRTNKSSTIRKRPATPPPEDSDASEYSSTDDESGARVKRRKTGGVNLAYKEDKQSVNLSRSSKFEADRSAVISQNDDATKSSNWNQAALEEIDSTKKREEGRLGGGKTVGPVKAPANVRQITYTDFAPDVCKDYKQTGFCGFGDSCKYLHAREDYAAGWKLDKEWEKAQKDKKAGQPAAKEELNEEEALLESIPFKCIICKEDYKMPVVTKCGHYFCERCAMTRYMKDKKRTCANCGADTGGSFSIAKKLKEILGKKRKRMEQKKAEARERGEEVSESEDSTGET